MSNRKIQNHVKKSLSSLKTNMMKHKPTFRGSNYVNKVNWMIPSNGSSLTREELTQLWIKYSTHGHFRCENSELIKKKSMDDSKNRDKIDKNSTASKNTQSIRVVSTNTWNWAQVTEIIQSNESSNEMNPINIIDDASDINNFAKVLINQKWLPEKNTSNLSNTGSSSCEFYNNNGFMLDYCPKIFEPNQQESVNYQFDQDFDKENLDPNIISGLEYNNYYHHQYHHNMNGHHNVLHEMNNGQNNNQTMNNNSWYNDQRTNLVESLEARYNLNNRNCMMYNTQNQLNSRCVPLPEYSSL